MVWVIADVLDLLPITTFGVFDLLVISGGCALFSVYVNTEEYGMLFAGTWYYPEYEEKLFSNPK